MRIRFIAIFIGLLLLGSGIHTLAQNVNDPAGVSTGPNGEAPVPFPWSTSKTPVSWKELEGLWLARDEGLPVYVRIRLEQKTKYSYDISMVKLDAASMIPISESRGSLYTHYKRVRLKDIASKKITEIYAYKRPSSDSLKTPGMGSRTSIKASEPTIFWTGTEVQGQTQFENLVRIE